MTVRDNILDAVAEYPHSVDELHAELGGDRKWMRKQLRKLFERGRLTIDHTELGDVYRLSDKFIEEAEEAQAPIPWLVAPSLKNAIEQNLWVPDLHGPPDAPGVYAYKNIMGEGAPKAGYRCLWTTKFDFAPGFQDIASIMGHHPDELTAHQLFYECQDAIGLFGVKSAYAVELSNILVTHPYPDWPTNTVTEIVRLLDQLRPHYPSFLPSWWLTPEQHRDALYFFVRPPGSEFAPNMRFFGPPRLRPGWLPADVALQVRSKKAGSAMPQGLTVYS